MEFYRRVHDGRLVGVEMEPYSESAFGVPVKMVTGVCVGGSNCYHGYEEGEAAAHLHHNKTESIVLEPGDRVARDPDNEKYYYSIPSECFSAEYEQPAGLYHVTRDERHRIAEVIPPDKYRWPGDEELRPLSELVGCKLTPLAPQSASSL